MADEPRSPIGVDDDPGVTAETVRKYAVALYRAMNEYSLNKYGRRVTGEEFRRMIAFRVRPARKPGDGMSAFVVGTKTIDRVVDVLCGPAAAFETDAQLAARGQALLDLNRTAVGNSFRRKRSPQEVYPDDQVAAYRYTYRKETDWVRLAAVDCFLYQCDEEGSYDQLLFGTVAAARQRLADKLLAEAAEYQSAIKESAAWGG